MPNQDAMEIATIINNAIVLLWQQGFIESATAEIDFGIITDIPEAPVAKQHGYSWFYLACEDPRMGMNFPQVQGFRIARHRVKEVVTEIFEQRRMLLEQLAEMSGVALEEDPEDNELVFTSSSDLPSLGPDPNERPKRRPRSVDLPSLGPDDE